MSYTTVRDVQTWMLGTDGKKTGDTPRQIYEAIRTVTNRVRTYGYEFEPQYNTMKYTPNGMNVNSFYQTLQLKGGRLRYLLEALAISVGGVDVIYNVDILPYPDVGLTPVRQLRIAKPVSGPIHSWYPCCTSQENFMESIHITGFWGMREYYTSSAYLDSGNTTPTMTSTQGSIVVSNLMGTDEYGRSPIFSPGSLLRIENELLEVIGTTTTIAPAGTLTVLRGWNGSTAVAHAAGLPILTFEIEPDISNMSSRQCGLMLARRGSYQKVTSFPDGVNVTYPADLLTEISRTIQRYNML